MKTIVSENKSSSMEVTPVECSEKMTPPKDRPMLDIETDQIIALSQKYEEDDNLMLDTEYFTYVLRVFRRYFKNCVDDNLAVMQGLKKNAFYEGLEHRCYEDIKFFNKIIERIDHLQTYIN